MSRYPLKPKTKEDNQAKDANESKPNEASLAKEQDAGMDKKDVTAETPKKKRKRVPIGTRNVLKFSKRPGYVRRVVNDVDDRIQRFKDAGYEIVHGDETGGDPIAGAASKMGSAVNKPVGGGVTGVLMEIPEEYYHEDQAAKQAEIDKIESGMRRKLRPDQADERLGQYGNVSIS
jgi:hypothetical protein